MRSFSLSNALTLGATFDSLVMPLATAHSLPNLRIMPFCDSITKGNGDPHNNGYCYRVRTKILDFGTESENGVDMIGSLRNGDMLDNDHEGHSGDFLDTIRDSIQS